MFNSKGIVSFTTYSFILVLLMLLLVFCFYFKESFEDEAVYRVSRIECLDAASSLRSSLIDSIRFNNTNVTFYRPNEVSEIYYLLNGSEILAVKENAQDRVEVSVSMFGYEFCNSYLVSPRIRTSFIFNGSCINVTMS